MVVLDLIRTVDERRLLKRAGRAAANVVTDLETIIRKMLVDQAGVWLP